MSTAVFPVNQPPAEKIRSEDRFHYATYLVFHSETGRIYEGTTRDVSLNGAYLITTQVPEDIQVGHQGVVEIAMKNETGAYTMTIPCVVARVSRDGLGLSFEDA